MINCVAKKFKKKYRVIFNFVPIKSGGGLQNTLSFLSVFSSYNKTNDYLIVCNKKSEIERLCITNNLEYQSIMPGKWGRLLYELFFGEYLILRTHSPIIFNLFGSAPFISFGIYKISGFAYSNIIQPEIPFWGFLPWYNRLWKKFIDKLRYWLAMRSDEIIVETDYLFKRAKEGVFKGKCMHIIKMAPSIMVLDTLTASISNPTPVFRDTIDILYLSGPHPNKRIHQLGPTFFALNHGDKKYRLITTLPETSSYFTLIKREFQKSGAIDTLHNIGPVAPSQVGTLLGVVDGMINIALLESFSNNWVESWAAGLPLIVTDADWARYSCRDAAIYIDPDSPYEAANRIASIFKSQESLQQQKEKGKLQLANLPTPEQKFQQYISIIEAARERLETRT